MFIEILFHAVMILNSSVINLTLKSEHYIFVIEQLFFSNAGLPPGINGAKITLRLKY
jgi:hypothetical protein